MNPRIYAALSTATVSARKVNVRKPTKACRYRGNRAAYQLPSEVETCNAECARDNMVAIARVEPATAGASATVPYVLPRFRRFGDTIEPHTRGGAAVALAEAALTLDCDPRGTYEK